LPSSSVHPRRHQVRRSPRSPWSTPVPLRGRRGTSVVLPGYVRTSTTPRDPGPLGRGEETQVQSSVSSRTVEAREALRRGSSWSGIGGPATTTGTTPTGRTKPATRRPPSPSSRRSLTALDPTSRPVGRCRKSCSTAPRWASPHPSRPRCSRSPICKREVRAVLGGGLWPQAVLRLGHASPGRPRSPTRHHIGVNRDGPRLRSLSTWFARTATWTRRCMPSLDSSADT
jgi:hypothetical protein